jgi:hypothetical protein
MCFRELCNRTTVPAFDTNPPVIFFFALKPGYQLFGSVV